MFNWLLAIDIMGGGASAPKDTSLSKGESFSTVFLIIILCVSIIFLIFYLDKKRKK